MDHLQHVLVGVVTHGRQSEPDHGGGGGGGGHS